MIGTLARFASAFGLGSYEAEEVAQETLAHVAMQDLGKISKPGAYLFWTARHRAIDKLRRDHRHARSEILAWDVEATGLANRYSAADDAMAGLIEQDASADLVEHALRAANAADDALTVRVVGAWLELADELGRQPASRDVAPRAGVSHTSVNQCLKRFKSYLPETP